MGVFQDGISACPSGLDQEDGGLFGEDSAGQDSGPGGLSTGSYIPPDNPSWVVCAYIEPSAISFGDRGSAKSVESVAFHPPELKDRLISLGALTIKAAYPAASLRDTLAYDTNGESVSLPDISSYYRLEFRDPIAAVSAIQGLLRTPGIRSAEVLLADPMEAEFPSDPYFESWRPNSRDSTYVRDAQWHLQNDGQRYDPDCGTALAGADVNAQGAWALGLGDSSTVIGFIDTGILGGIEADSCHEDLRVIPLSYAQRESISSHPDIDWFSSHGTRMAGTAAARTDNAVGVAGICGDCSIMDIESGYCWYDYTPPSESQCNLICWDPPCEEQEWTVNLEGALDLDLPEPYVLRVINMSFGRSLPSWLETYRLMALWRGFARNVVFVASAGDSSNAVPMTHSLANVPFVLGVGGINWKGEFWDADHTCYGDDYPTKGTTVGFSEVTDFGGPSGRCCDVCVPASGKYVTTEPVVNDSMSGYYWPGSGMTSGASAQGAGLAGLVQSLAREYYGSDIKADDVVGIVEASAKPWPADSTHPSYGATCRDCPAEYFGNGVMNAAGAVALVTPPHNALWNPSGDPDLCERIAGKYGAIHSGSWQFALVDADTVWRANVDTLWLEYEAQAVLDIPSRFTGPPSRDEESLMPEFVAWVRRDDRARDNPEYKKTNTFSSYSQNMAQRIDMMWAGVTDCRMSVINQSTGQATISGFTYAYVDPVAGDTVFVVPEDSVRMAYVVMCNTSVGVDEQAAAQVPSPFELSGDEVQPRTRVTLDIVVSEPGELEMEVCDVAGRVMQGFELGRLESGVHVFKWDGRGRRGERLAPGVYWIRGRLGEAVRTKRLLLMGR